jgi:pimeloyl-ACP methyl ester carboxylesterase
MNGFRIVEHKVPASHLREFPRATAVSEEDVLYLAVKQYIPLDNPHPLPGDVTLIGAHACGFNKELYEPTWEELVSQAKKQGWRLRSIWMADSAWHGTSAQLNDGLLGNDPNWFDHSRDLMNLINIHRDEMARPLVGVGHSMGGCQIAKLAMDHPSLFTSLVLIDPVIQHKSAELVPGESGPALMSTFRRPVWPSREEAKQSFLKSPFYKVWDARVLDRWIQYGLRACPNPQFPDLPSPQVSLATPVAQELFSFVRPNYEGYGVGGKRINRVTHPDLDPRFPNQHPFYRAEPISILGRLPELRPSVLYIFGSTSVVSTASMNEQKLALTGTGVGGSGGVAEGRVKGVTFEGIGHLIAMETPSQTAAIMAEWVATELEIFNKQRKELKEWFARPLEEKQKVDELWIETMRGALPKKKKGAKL